MIRDRIIASRYIDAYFTYARSGIGTEKAFSDLKQVKDMLRESPDLGELLENPEIGVAAKYSIIDRVIDGDLSDEIRHFLKLLITHRRIENFADMAEYARIYYSHGGEQECLLKTSYPLEIDTIRRIQEKLQEKFKRRFKFYIELDSRLLGGVQVIMGNRIIDGSVRRRLEDLKEKLKSVRVG